MSDLDVLPLIAEKDRQAPPPAADATLVIDALVLAVDIARREVQVAFRGVGLWLPAQPGRYLVGGSGADNGRARVQMDPIAARPVLVLGPVNPRPGLLRGSMTASGAETATVNIEGTSYVLPYMVGTYGSLPRTVWVTTDDWGVPVRIDGPTAVAAPPPPPPPPPAPVPPPPSSVAATATLGPQWSSGYRHRTGKWGGSDGPSDLFQGTGPGIGQVTGLATYGDQIVNLGASSIQRIRVRVQRLGGGNYAPVALVVQASEHAFAPNGAPSGSGPTFTLPAVGIGGWAEADLPVSFLNAFHAGTAKGLVVAGTDYSRWGGTAVPGSMVLTVDYTRPA